VADAPGRAHLRRPAFSLTETLLLVFQRTLS
jgi:hypothetical protein